jgi:hypothetical protein
MPPEITIRVAIELSHSSWIVAVRLPDVEKSRLHRLEGGDTTALLTLLDDLRSRALTKLGSPAKVACCFEAGRDRGAAVYAGHSGEAVAALVGARHGRTAHR